MICCNVSLPTMRYAAAVVGLLLLVRTVGADAIDDKTVIGVSYYQCVRPAGVRCIALDPDHICKRCREPGLWTDALPAKEAFKERRYAAGEDHANKFLQDSLVELYHFTREEAERFVPHRMADLYGDPERYGWMRLEEMRPGAFIIDRYKAAIILPDPAELADAPTPGAESSRPPLTFRGVLHDPTLV